MTRSSNVPMESEMKARQVARISRKLLIGIMKSGYTLFASHYFHNFSPSWNSDRTLSREDSWQRQIATSTITRTPEIGNKPQLRLDWTRDIWEDFQSRITWQWRPDSSQIIGVPRLALGLGAQASQCKIDLTISSDIVKFQQFPTISNDIQKCLITSYERQGYPGISKEIQILDLFLTGAQRSVAVGVIRLTKTQVQRTF